MKNKIALASAFVAASSLATAEVVINDFLSVEGFVDMSYSATDQEVNNGKESDNSFGLDQVEIDWLFDFDPVTAQIDLAYLGSDNSRIAFADTNGDSLVDSGTVVEQAFATYHMDNGSAITAGRFASMLGFEAFEPTGLYQYSRAYNPLEDVTTNPFNAVIGENNALGTRYDQGVKYTYESDMSFFGVSVVDSVNVGRLGGDDVSDFGVEVAGAINFDNGFSWFAGGRYDEGNEDATVIPPAYQGFDNRYILNSYVTFETGPWVFAGELAYSETDFGSVNPNDLEIFQALLMANFAYSEQASITGRVSYVEGDNGAAVNSDEDFVKYTLAHGYAFTDNLSLVNEISYVDGETNVGNDVETLTAAVELIFSF